MLLQSVMSEYFPDIDYCKWLEDDSNIFLIDEYGNAAVFEGVSRGVHRGHYFFRDRGRLAINAASSFLREFFQIEGTETLTGVTPLKYLGARWLSKQLGFKSLGVIETQVGPSELVMMTKKEWETKE